MPMTKLIAAALVLVAGSALADPGYYVVTPYDNAGIRTVDFRYWAVKPKGSGEVIWPELGLSYGVNSRWTTTVFQSYIGSSTLATQPSTLNWQNTVLLTQGELPVDIGLHLQLISDRRRSDRRAIEFGPLLQADFGRTRANLNLIFDRGFSDTAPPLTQLKYQWQLRHRWTPALQFGAEGFGELGRWDDWLPSDRQSHRAGPALFGTLKLGEREAVKGQAAFLLGKTYGQRGHMFTLRTIYEF